MSKTVWIADSAPQGEVETVEILQKRNPQKPRGWSRSPNFVTHHFCGHLDLAFISFAMNGDSPEGTHNVLQRGEAKEDR